MNFKLQTLHALTDALKTITPANGYVNDLSDFDPGDGVTTPRVYRGRAFFGENDPVPMLSILEAVDDGDTIIDSKETSAVSEYWWSLIVQGWVLDDPVNPTDPAYTLLADVRKCLALQAQRRHSNNTETQILGMPWTKVRGLQFGPGIVRPANELSAYAGFHLRVELWICDVAEDGND